tara:strand:+ start:398 stop:961 length:564 start_codon:yes stop_codon:yes gene_type:complete
MRIISGDLKGKSISFVKSKITRPLKDSVKENIFNVIAHSNLIDIKLAKSKVLDLYSGIGSFGIECISRGSEETTFVEKDKIVVNTLEKNLKDLSLIKKSIVVNKNIVNFLESNISKQYDIIFLDPPFAEKKILSDLQLIQKRKIYKANHLIVIHREIGSFDQLEQILKILMTKEYGRSKIIFAKFLS